MTEIILSYVIGPLVGLVLGVLFVYAFNWWLWRD